VQIEVAIKEGTEDIATGKTRGRFGGLSDERRGEFNPADSHAEEKKLTYRLGRRKGEKGRVGG